MKTNLLYSCLGRWILLAWLLGPCLARSQSADVWVGAGRLKLQAHDLTGANSDFQSAVAISPDDPAANVFLAITRLALLEQKPPAQAWLTRWGFPLVGRDLYHWQAKPPHEADGSPVVPPGISAADATSLLRTNVVPEIGAALANLAKVTSPNFVLPLTALETGGQPVQVDRGDILLIRSGLHWLEYVGSTLHSWDLDLDLSVIRSLAVGGNLTGERLLARFPRAFSFASTNDLAFAYRALGNFVGRYNEASEFIRSRPAGVTRLFNWDSEMAGDEASFRSLLDQVRLALDGPVLWDVGRGISVDARKLFNGQSSPRDWLPRFHRDAMVAGTFPDASFGGLITGLSPLEVENYFTSDHQLFGKQVPALRLAPRLESPRLSADGAIEFVAHGQDGEFLFLEVSSDLLNWTVLSGARIVDGLASLRDFEGVQSARRFYRVVDGSTSFTLSGLAFDFWNNRPMAGATVHLEIQGFGIPSLETTTGADGRFLFVVEIPFPFSSFPYTLTMSPPGYDLQSSTGYATQGEHLEAPVVFRDTSLRPTNDPFANRIVLEGDRATAIGDNWQASSEFGEPEHDVLSGGPTDHRSVWWSYTPATDGTIRIRSLASDGVRTIAIYTGVVPTALSRVTADQAEYYGGEFSVTFHGIKGTEYAIAIDSLLSVPTPFEFELRFSATPGGHPYQIETLAGDPYPTAKDGVGRDARFSGPQGLGRNPKGDLWVTDSGNQLIRRVSFDGKVSTVAGLPGNPGSLDGSGSAARFDSPSDVVFDRQGNAYVADYGDHTIRKITPDGEVTTVAGKAGQAGYRDGLAGAARFHNPSGLAILNDGTLYVSEAWNHTVRRISTYGEVTTVAGAAEEPGSVDGPGLEARFDMPLDVEADGAGNLYVADFNNHLIRKVAPNGAVTTIAGQPHDPGSIDGNRITARLDRPAALAIDALGDLGFVQGDHTVRKLFSDGRVFTLAGLTGNPGSADGLGSKARFRFPSGIVSDGQAGWWIDDYENNTVRHLDGVGRVSTLAGSAVTNSADGFGAAARFNGPSGIALETSGSIIVGDWNNQTVRRILPSGEVTTLAGLAGNPGSEDGQGSEARFSGPADVAVSPDGTIVLADWVNHTLRRITPSGKVSTIAGDPAISGWENGTGSDAHFVFPSGVCVDGAGTIYLADSGAQLIRRITSSGVVTTVAGIAGVSGSVNARGLDASFNGPSDVAIDEVGNLFVADSGNHLIRRIAADGTVSTYAGAVGESGGVDGPRLTARFFSPALLAFGPDKALYIVESGHTLRRIDPSGLVQTLAGRTSDPAYFDGPGSAARFRFPAGVAVDGKGTVVIADYANNVVRTVSALSETKTIAGLAVPGGLDGLGIQARFDGPAGITVDSLGVLYVADWNNTTIRKVSPNGDVTTLAGSAGHPGVSDGLGRFAQFTQPADLVLDSHGNLFVVDSGAHTIRKVSPLGEVSTFAGKAGESGSEDGLGSAARFFNPGGIGIGADDTLYVADSGNNTLRKIESSGLVSTLAGSSSEVGYTDGLGLNARFSTPSDVAVDPLGNLYVADTGNNSIRRITPQGQVITLAGYRGRPGSADGQTRVARFQSPISLAVDPSGDLIVADYLNLTLRRVTPTGEVTTIAGAPGFPSVADGAGVAARFKAPGGIAIDKLGQVYISDYTANVIRKGRLTP